MRAELREKSPRILTSGLPFERQKSPGGGPGHLAVIARIFAHWQCRRLIFQESTQALEEERAKGEGLEICLVTSLLLVIHLGATYPVALRVNSAHGDSAALAIGRNGNPSADDYLTAFHDVEPQYMLVDHGV